MLAFASNSRSNHQRYSVKQGALRNFTKFTGKHLCQSLFFNKVAGLRPATLLKKRLWHRRFPVNFVKFLRTPFLQNTSGGCFRNSIISLLFTSRRVAELKSFRRYCVKEHLHKITFWEN